MSGHFADRWLAAAKLRGSPVCVGIDPVYDRLPEALRRPGRSRLDAIADFCYGVIRAAAGTVPAVKPQSAYFEAFGPEGVALYFKVVRRARQAGLLVIGDVKRNDIGSTAEAYAEGHLAGKDAPDAITVNGYLGADGLLPFIEAAQEEGRGVFVLVRTSNPSAAAIQDFRDTEGKRFFERLAALTAELGDKQELLGQGGYSCVGAVVGATWPQEARELRAIMPRQLFLIPGYGAQGATATDCAASFRDDGAGGIVNASRSVIYPHQKPEYAQMDWQEAIAAAARAFADEIAKAVAGRRPQQ